MRITFLGSGTSHGVPMIGCDCPVCCSDNPKNNRTRSSIYVETETGCLVIDTAPEFRIQVLRERIRRVDAILFTHAHADHLLGLDDVRSFNGILRSAMPCYALPETLDAVMRAFQYVFVPTQEGTSKPALELIAVDGPFCAAGIPVTPIKVKHGILDILGYRIENFAYITDASSIPDSSLALLDNLDVLVLGVIRHQPHNTHFCVSEGLEVVKTLRPRATYFTHIAHNLDHQSTNSSLPSNIQLAYDGLKITL